MHVIYIYAKNMRCGATCAQKLLLRKQKTKRKAVTGRARGPQAGHHVRAARALPPAARMYAARLPRLSLAARRSFPAPRVPRHRRQHILHGAAVAVRDRCGRRGRVHDQRLAQRSLEVRGAPLHAGAASIRSAQGIGPPEAHPGNTSPPADGELAGSRGLCYLRSASRALGDGVVQVVGTPARVGVLRGVELQVAVGRGPTREAREIFGRIGSVDVPRRGAGGTRRGGHVSFRVGVPPTQPAKRPTDGTPRSRALRLCWRGMRGPRPNREIQIGRRAPVDGGSLSSTAFAFRRKKTYRRRNVTSARLRGVQPPPLTRPPTSRA